MSDLDLVGLENLARRAYGRPHWCIVDSLWDCGASERNGTGYEYVRQMTPEVVLELISRVQAAERSPRSLTGKGSA